MAKAALSIDIEAGSPKLDGQLRAAEAKFKKSAGVIEKATSFAGNLSLGKGLGLAVVGISGLRAGVALLRGDFEKVGDVIDSLPFGIGRLAQEIFGLVQDGMAALGTGVKSAVKEAERAAKEIARIKEMDRRTEIQGRAFATGNQIEEQLKRKIRILQTEEDKRAELIVQMEYEDTFWDADKALPGQKENIRILAKGVRDIEIHQMRMKKEEEAWAKQLAEINQRERDREEEFNDRARQNEINARREGERERANKATIEREVRPSTITFRQLFGLQGSTAESDKPISRAQGVDVIRYLRNMVELAKAREGVTAQ